MYLDDDTLKEVAFTNIPVPSGSEQSLILPRLLEGLKKNTHVEKVNLQNTSLTDADCLPFEQVLEENEKIQYLSLDSNPLTATAACAVARGLGTSKTLSELRLHNLMGVANASGGGGCRAVETALNEAVAKNDTLLRLGYTLTDPNARDRIDRKVMKNNDAARQKRQEAKKLLMSGNSTPGEAAVAAAGA